MNIYLAEMLGTMLLVLLGNGVVANVILNKTKGNSAGWVAITLGWGLAVSMAIYSVGWISGAQINPAVTIALAVIGKFDWALVPGYILSQLVGAFVGSILVWLVYKGHYDTSADSNTLLATFATGPAIRNTLQNFSSELIATAVLMFGVLSIVNEKNMLAGGMAALMIGLLVVSIGLSLGGPTGYAINPARDLGPRIAHHLLPIKNKRDSDWSYAWVPILAPIIGAILGALLYTQILAK